jgi:hypothetical protein
MKIISNRAFPFLLFFFESDDLNQSNSFFLSKFVRTSSFSPDLAISENGLLPYQLCGSNESYLGAGISFSSFIHNGVENLIAVTASSSWGEGARIPRVEFLAYFRLNHLPGSHVFRSIWTLRNSS